MTANTSIRMPRYWSPRTRPRSAPPVFCRRPTTATASAIIHSSSNRALKVRQRLAATFTTNPTIRYVVGMSLTVAVLVSLLCHPAGAALLVTLLATLRGR